MREHRILLVPGSDFGAAVLIFYDFHAAGAELLALSPTCLKTVKWSFNQMIDLMPCTEVVAKIAPDYFSTGEQKEGAQAFLERRNPDFSRWR